MRGKLKIYLGFAPGVGKTYRMLADALLAKSRGLDVVAGYIEPHDRPDVRTLTTNLEQVPPLAISHRGATFYEVDTQAVIARRPAAVLVDEIAHTNAPGSKNAKRYQDVEELLAAGVSVISTMNVQHIESCAEAVEQTLGIKVGERIPDDVVIAVDRLTYVDVEPQELIERLEAGQVHKLAQAAHALEHFFRPENLSQLRRIALAQTLRLLDQRGPRGY